MVRKLAIAAVPVFIKSQPTGSLQAVLGEIVIVIYIFVISYLKPFGAPEDNLLQVGSMLGESQAYFKLSYSLGYSTDEINRPLDHYS